jgi:hypothetical protein
MPSHSSHNDTERFEKNVKVPVGKIGAIAFTFLTCVGVFELLVPSNSKVDAALTTANEAKEQIKALEAVQKTDHDVLIGISRDVNYIRHQLEQEERKRQP